MCRGYERIVVGVWRERGESVNVSEAARLAGVIWPLKAFVGRHRRVHAGSDRAQVSTVAAHRVGLTLYPGLTPSAGPAAATRPTPRSAVPPPPSARRAMACLLPTAVHGG